MNLFETLALILLRIEQYYGPDDIPMLPEDKEMDARNSLAEKIKGSYESGADDLKSLADEVLREYGEYAPEE